MAIKDRRLCLFFALFFLIGLPCVYAQIAGYYIDNEGDEPRFFQRLAWSGGSYALRYEIVIERDMGETFRIVHQEFTTSLFVEVSLHPGNYRFHVISYDVLDRPYVTSEWKYIEILPAMQPELLSVLPEYITNQEEYNGFLIDLTGNNLDPNAEIFIRYADGTRIEAESVASNGGFMFFLESDLLPDSLVSGECEIIIRNPGGLEASIGGIRLQKPEIAEHKPEIETYINEEQPPETDQKLKSVLFSAGLAYIPSFPIYGNFMNNDISMLYVYRDFIDLDAFFVGLTARLNLLFYVPIGIYIGPELSVMANYLNLYVGGNLLFRKWFPNQRAALSFRAGADYGIADDSITDIQVNIRMDISFLWRVSNRLILEAGVDYSHFVWKTEHFGILLEYSGGFIRPWLGIGWQF